MWDTATAEREFRRAIELDPNNPVAHHWYATYLVSMRRYPESLAEIERAQVLDPTSNSVVADKGTILFSAGRRDEATALLKQVEETDPNFMSPHRELKYIYLLTSDYPDYLVESRKEALILHSAAGLAIADGAERAFASGGGKAMLVELRNQQKKLYDQGLFSPYYLAETCAIMGNKREALQYLQATYDKRADGVLEMDNNPAFNHLHSEPAYRSLASKVGLPLS
jgi:tetratricopeptide (TPR) repeat protein